MAFLLEDLTSVSMETSQIFKEKIVKGQDLNAKLQILRRPNKCSHSNFIYLQRKNGLIAHSKEARSKCKAYVKSDQNTS